MRLLSSSCYVVDSCASYDAIHQDTLDKNVLLVCMGMLDTDRMDEMWFSYFNPALVLSRHWITIFVKNETHGLISDLVESAAGKMLGDITSLISGKELEYPARVVRHIIEHRPINRKLVVMCHSQGGIIVDNALEDCSSIPHETHAVFMGAANWTLPSTIPASNSVVISNVKDYVALLFGRLLFPGTIRFNSGGYFHEINGYSHHVWEITRQIVQPDFKVFDRNSIKNVKV